MAKSVYSIRIDPGVWERFQERYPRQASPMIEEILKDLVASDVKEGVSREEIALKLQEIRENKAKSDQKERILSQQLLIFDKEKRKQEEIFNSEDAKNRKEQYFELKQEERLLFGNLCSEIQALKLPNFDQKITPCYLYSDFSEEMTRELFNKAEEMNAFTLVSALKQFKIYQNKKENGEI